MQTDDDHVSSVSTVIEGADDSVWVEEVDEVMFQPTEIVPNSERCHKNASELQKQIVNRLRPGNVA
jgi:hypothetical protein